MLQLLKERLDVKTQTHLAAVNRAAYDELDLPCRDPQEGSALHGPRFRLLQWQHNPDGSCSPGDVLTLAEGLPACFRTLHHPFERVLAVPGARRQPTDAAALAVAAFATIRANADSAVDPRDPEPLMPHLDDLEAVHGVESHCVRQLRLEAVLCGGRQSPPGERPALRLEGLVQRLLEWGGSIRRIRLWKVASRRCRGYRRCWTTGRGSAWSCCSAFSPTGGRRASWSSPAASPPRCPCACAPPSRAGSGGPARWSSGGVTPYRTRRSDAGARPPCSSLPASRSSSRVPLQTVR